MTPKQFEKRAIALCRGFWPETERLYDGGAEFTWSTGLRVHLMFSRKYTHIRGKSSDWIHFDLFKLGEVMGRNIYPRADYVWWKWNAHFSPGPINDIRSSYLELLENRLNRCVEVGAINKLTGEAKT